MGNIEQEIMESALELEGVLSSILPSALGNKAMDRLFTAMSYSALGGGKRLRPYLLLTCADLFSVSRKVSLRVAAALELVHTYSLIHDDLPSMDDDDMRRGKASCHIRFDEATAILAGDAMLTLAFEILSEIESSASIRCSLISALARASGAYGMVGGQMFDLEAKDMDLSLSEIKHLQNLKTGRLLVFSCLGGAILGGASPEQMSALRDYGGYLGLAFQITDDLLDVTGDEEALGKKAGGKDNANGKATLINILGIDNARKHAEALISKAILSLACFGERRERLTKIAEFVISRGR